jgi:hypothetical protein
LRRFTEWNDKGVKLSQQLREVIATLEILTSESTSGLLFTPAYVAGEVHESLVMSG